MIAVGAQTKPRRSTPLDRLMRRVVLAKLRRLGDGSILIREGDSGVRVGAESNTCATVRVLDPRFYRRIACGGNLAAARSYVQGEWDCDDLTALFRLFIRNEAASERLDAGWSRPSQWLHRLVHALRGNSRSGSRRNIHVHYDLGNDFYQCWLDQTMSYSCGVFTSPDATLQSASLEKLDRTCRKLELRPDDELLEIGSGWGGLAIHAARNHGCRVTTTTISDEQFTLAKRRIDDDGLADRIKLLSRDYRDLHGQFDKLVSIEMIEAVGHRYLDAYFRKCRELLKPNGSMLMQAIVMPERGYDRYLHSVDFIRRYVFPGGCLPSVASILESIGRTTRMRLVHLEDMAPHYAETLRRWRSNLHNRRWEARRRGYSVELLRLWEYYLCYCEAAFEERRVGLVQMVFDNYARRRDPLLIGQRATQSAEPRLPAVVLEGVR